MLKKIFSYIYPFNIKEIKSQINGKLEINLINGKKTLDTDICNYSYGALQKILHKGLVEINFPNKIKNILLLGLGGGSVIETIRDVFKSEILIKAVDIDPEMILIAKNEFIINRFNNLEIIEYDAFEYLKICNEKYDLIIVDIFIGNKIPEKFTKFNFLDNLVFCLNENGRIIYNIMNETLNKTLFNDIVNILLKLKIKIKILENLENTNSVIIGKK